MSDLSTLVEALKREVAVPGTFDDLYPNTSPLDLTGSLADSFAQCQLDGWFPSVTLDLTNAAHPATTPDLSTAGQGLVVITAGIRFVRAALRVMGQTQTYKAGNVEYSTSNSASVMKQDLADLDARRTQLLTQAQLLARPLDTVYDGYANRQAADFLGIYGWGFGFYPYEFPAILTGIIG